MVEVHAVERVPLVVGLFVERDSPPPEVPHVVHEHVDATEVVMRRGDQRVSRSGFPHVADDARDALADRGLRLSGALGVDFGQDHGGALVDETLDDPAADPATSARDDCDLALEHGAAA